MPYTSVIITIGDELLIGQTIDTNSAWIAQQLNAIGITVKQRIAVADARQAIVQALDEAIKEADLIFMTGGLGPTSDDITKPVLAEYFGGGAMVIHETVLQHIEQLFLKRNRPFLDSNRKQAEVPDQCQVLFNRMGTAPGMWFEKEKKVIISLPGVPFEMQTIVTEEVLPRLRVHFPGKYILHKTLITAGVGESFIAGEIAGIEKNLPEYISLAYLPSPGMVKLRLSTSASDAAEADARRQETDTWAGLVMQRLGKVVAATEDIRLEEVVGRLLSEHRLQLGLAESCTGGCVASRITDVPGSSAYFKGAVVSYANEVKHTVLGVPDTTLHTVGAVSEAAVRAMAEGAHKLLGSDIALSISGILGPNGGTPDKPVGTVWMAVTNGLRTESKMFQFFYDRVRNKEMAANAALNMIRLFISANYQD